MDKYDNKMSAGNVSIARNLPAKEGIQWVVSAWGQFRAYPLAWIALTFIYVAIQVFLSFVDSSSGFGSLVAFILTPILGGGLFIAAATGDNGSSPRLQQLFSAFNKTHAVRLVLATILYGLVAFFFLMLVMLLFSPFMPFVPQPGTTEAFFQNLSLITIIIFLGLIWVFVFLLLPYSIIQGLMIFTRLPVHVAVYRAFCACLYNWRPVTLYMLILSIPAIFSLLFLFMGLAGAIVIFAAGIIFYVLIEISGFYMFKSLFTVSVPDSPEGNITSRIE